MASFKTYSFKGKKAILRVDFNVPLNKETFEITDDKRMQAALPTINKILSDGGSVIIISARIEHFAKHFLYCINV